MRSRSRWRGDSFPLRILDGLAWLSPVKNSLSRLDFYTPPGSSSCLTLDLHILGSAFHQEETTLLDICILFFLFDTVDVTFSLVSSSPSEVLLNHEAPEEEEEYPVYDTIYWSFFIVVLSSFLPCIQQRGCVRSSSLPAWYDEGDTGRLALCLGRQVCLLLSEAEEEI